jgi:hypothetical protein
MAIPDRYLRLRSSQPYITTESTSGSYVAVAAGDAFTTTDPLSLSQTFNTTDINEVGTRLLQNRSCVNYAERATFDIPFLVKPSGTAGTAPAEDAILQKIFGTKTVASSTSVTYSFANVATTFQVAQLVDTYKLYVSNGTKIEGFSMDISRNGILQMNANARGQRIRFSGPVNATGTDVSVTDSSAATVTLDVATNAVASDYFFAGQLVDIYDSSDTQVNTGGAATISSPSGSAATVGVQAYSGDSFTVSATDYLVPHLPAATLSTYEPLCMDKGQVYVGAQNAAVGTGSGQIFHTDNEFLATDFSVSASFNIGDPGISEMNGTLYPAAAYVTNQIDINGSFNFVLRPAQAYRFEQFIRTKEVSLGVQIGDTSGSILRIAIPSARVSIAPSEQDGAAAATVDFTLTQGSSTTDAGAFSLIYL